MAGCQVYLKPECLQKTGSFKIRGAVNKIFSLSDEEKERGVIAVSSGNHGRAVAYVADRLGVQATICLSGRVPSVKVDGIRALGAEVVIHGQSYDEAEELSFELERERGLTRIDPFDDALVIAGQGTIGLELLEDLPEMDTVVVPLSGGGLFSGIALAVKSASSSIRTVGVSMDREPAMYRSLRAGEIVDVVEVDTIADGLAGGIGKDNKYTFEMLHRYADDTVLVSEDEIKSAMAFALREHHLVVEGSGAVGLAAVMYGRAGPLGDTVAVVISGANVNMPVLLEIADKYQDWRPA
jgi:threonine dehydratase